MTPGLHCDDCGEVPTSGLLFECGRCKMRVCGECGEQGVFRGRTADGTERTGFWIRCRICLAAGDNPEDRVDYHEGAAEPPRPPCPCGQMTIDDCAGECGFLDRAHLHPVFGRLFADLFPGP